jgi:hypothetical protein
MLISFNIRFAATVKVGAQTKKSIRLGAGKSCCGAPVRRVQGRHGRHVVSRRWWEMVSVWGGNLLPVGWQVMDGHGIMVPLQEARAVQTSAS